MNANNEAKMTKAGRKKKEAQPADGFENGVFQKTFTASKDSSSDMAGYTALYMIHNYGGLDNNADLPTMRFDLDKLSVEVEAKGNQLNNLMDQVYSQVDAVDSKGNAIKNVTSPALKKVSFNGEHFSQLYHDFFSKALKMVAFQNAQVRSAMFAPVNMDNLNAWYTDGCPDLSTVPTVKLKSYSSIGYFLSELASSKPNETDVLSAGDSGNANTGSATYSSKNSYFLSRFSILIAFLGNVKKVTFHTKAHKCEGEYDYTYLYGIPFVTDPSSFIKNEFHEYMKSVNDSSAEYEEYLVNATKKPRSFSPNIYLVPDQFGINCKYPIGRNSKNRDMFYSILKRKSSFRYMRETEYITSQYGMKIINESDYAISENKSRAFMILQSEFASRGVKGTTGNKLYDLFNLTQLFEMASYYAIIGKSDLFWYIGNGIDAALRRYMLTNKASSLGDAFIGGKYIPFSKCAYQNLNILKNIITSTIEISQTLDTETKMALDTMETETNNVIQLRNIISRMISSHLRDVDIRYSKDGNDEIKQIFYALTRHGHRNLKRFVNSTLVTKIGRGNLVAYNPDELHTLLSKMSDDEIYMSVFSSLQYSSNKNQKEST